MNDATSNLQLLLWGFPCLESSQIDYSVGGHQTPDHSTWKAWDGNSVILGKQILACLGPAAGKAEWMAVSACVLPISKGIVWCESWTNELKLYKPNCSDMSYLYRRALEF